MLRTAAAKNKVIPRPLWSRALGRYSSRAYHTGALKVAALTVHHYHFLAPLD